MAGWRDSIVLLTSSDPDNRGFGTGFVFHRDTTDRCFLLTCLHVVETLEKRRKDAPGEPAGVYAAGRPAEVWLRGDDILDLAVLAVDGLGLAPLRLGVPAQRGRPIQTAGFTDFEAEHKSVVSRPLEGTVRDNNAVWSRWPQARLRAWSLDIEIAAEAFRALTEGYSGSPVLDRESGAVVGVMNLKWSGTQGHALCVRSCERFRPPLSQRLPDYPPRHPGATAAPPGTPGPHPPDAVAAWEALAWLASTIDHTDPIERVARCLGDGQRPPPPGIWFHVFDACLSDCPRALAEHLAVRFADLSPDAAGIEDLVTELRPMRYDGQGLWRALAEKIVPPDCTADEASHILSWLKNEPSARPGGLRVVYCQLSVAAKGPCIPGLIAGAIQAFGGLRELCPEARVLFLFGCVFEESGLWGLLHPWRRPRLGHLHACSTLGKLPRVSLYELDDWLRAAAKLEWDGRRLDRQTQQHLRDTLERLFPTDAVRLRYRQIRRPALDILAQARLVPAHPGDPP